MEILEIKPSTRVVFKIPTSLEQKFVIGNLTLRAVCIYVVSLHPEFMTVTPAACIIDAFQELDVTVNLHWSQEVHHNFKSKLRVYIWECYEEQPLEEIEAKMFNRQCDGNCLMFEELTIECVFDSNVLQRNPHQLPLFYAMKRVSLPNNEFVKVSQQMIDKLLEHCERIGKVKAIYNMGANYIIEFGHCEDIMASFCELRDKRDYLAIFSIGCLMGLGSTFCSPDYLLLNRQPEATSKIKALVKAIPDSVDNKPLPRSEIQEVSDKMEEQAPHKEKTIPRFSKKDLMKQSFAMPNEPTQLPKNRRRNRSEETIRVDICEADEYEDESTVVDLQQLKEFRAGRTFESKIHVEYKETVLELGKRVLNFIVSEERGQVYILLRDCLIVCSLDNPFDKRTIKFDGVDAENLSLPTPMVMFDHDTTMIFGNESYLYWISLNNSFEPDWKYVQRKEIFAIEIVEELNLLIVGGKNFSKLSYLGKSTSRSNLKVYSCGKTGKRDHLYTYDIPGCNKENVLELKHITTKPNGTKLLLMQTSGDKIYFLRVRAYNEIQVQEIGLQEIVSLRYHPVSAILVCLERLDKDNLCFKFIKVNCSYEKVEVTTESVKLPVGPYQHEFRMGGDEGSEWISAIDQKGSIWSINLQWKQPVVKGADRGVKAGDRGVKAFCMLRNGGQIFQEQTSFKFKLPK